MRPEPLNQEFARLLAASGWSQAQAARELSLTPAVVSRYLSGETRPSLTVVRLFKLLLGARGALAPPAGPLVLKDERRQLRAGERELLDALDQFDEVTRQRVIEGFRGVLAALAPSPLPHNHRR